MKPLRSEADAETLRELGSASAQVVHDLKNQLNGLKLYATFLRKRMEKGERPADELETIAKLIAGLERAAGEMNLLVRYGRPLELRRQPQTDLARLIIEAAEGRSVETEEGRYEGDFDPMLLSEALKSITNGGRSDVQTASAAEPASIRLRREELGARTNAVVEWRGALSDEAEGDPFRSFAGGPGLRLALAAKIIRAHGGEAIHDAGIVRVSLPLHD